MMRKVGYLLSIALVLLIVTIFSVGLSARRPYKQARMEAFEIAKQKGNIETTDHFYWYNGEETYFSVTGKSNQNENLIVFIQQDTGNVSVFPQEGMITETNAKKIVKEDKKPKHILEARMGMLNDKPIWEISYKQENGRVGYYVLSMETGNWIRSIENI